jgi:hypothetical protein
MRYQLIVLGLILTFSLLSSSCAENTLRPWYGSKIEIQSILKSQFCVKYQCKLKDSYQNTNSMTKEKNNTYEIITKFTVDFDDIKRSVGKGDDTITLRVVKNQKKQIHYIDVQFQGGFGPPPYTYLRDVESQYLTDLVYFSLSKKYNYIPTDGDANPTDDMNLKCMNKIPLKILYRILERGKIIFEGEKDSVPYIAYCAIRVFNSNPVEFPKVNLPMFFINESIYLPK